MDAFNKLSDKLNHQQQPAAGQPAAGQPAAGQPAAGHAAAAATKEDYLDKAFDMGAKKAGYTVNRDTAEKITDGARNLFEKATGKKVPEKFSN